MISLLAKWLIHRQKDASCEAIRQSYGVLCGAVGIALNVLLSAAKFIAGMLSHSVAITGDALNNLSDAGSSLITLIGFRMAGKKPDAEHPFGHGRMEYLSGLIVAFLILLMGGELLKASVEKIFHPQDPETNAVTFVILSASILVKLYMMLYNRRFGKKFHSEAMLATAQDCLNDCITTAAVLLSTVIFALFKINVDAYCGTLLSLFILYSGIMAAKNTLDPLLGRPPEAEFVREIEQMVLSYEEVIGVHDLIVHDYGPGRRMISLHAEVSAAGDILDLHDTIDNIEQTLCREFGCRAVIHMDPISVDDEATCALRDKVQALLPRIGENVTMHDFRMVSGQTHTNLIFDVVVPFSLKRSDNEIKRQLSEMIAEIDQTLNAVIEIDRDYTNDYKKHIKDGKR